MKPSGLQFTPAPLRFVSKSTISNEVIFYIIPPGVCQRRNGLRIPGSPEFANVGLGEVLVFAAQDFGHFDVFNPMFPVQRGKYRPSQFVIRGADTESVFVLIFFPVATFPLFRQHKKSAV